jgi:type I restriction enzyme S subunit
MANGGAQQNLNSLQIKDFDILLPSLETQQKIAKVLSSIDDKIELNNSINNNLPPANIVEIDFNKSRLEVA